MFCTRCGTDNRDGARFCRSCGAELPAAPAAASGGEQVPEPAPQERPAPAPAPQPVPEAPAPRRRRGRAPAVAAAVVGGIAVLALAAFLVFRLVLSPGGMGVSEVASTASLSYGSVAAGEDGYDYFYSSAELAIMRARPGSAPEVVVEVPTRETSYGFEEPSFYVHGIAVTGDVLFYSCSLYDPVTYDTISQVRSMRTDGEGDVAVYEVESSEDVYASVGTLFAYDGRAYLPVSLTGDGGSGSVEVVSVSADGSDVRTECVLDDAPGNVVVTPERVYYAEYVYDANYDSHVSVYVRNIDGSGAERLYQVDGCSVYAFGLHGDALVFSEADSSGGASRIVSVAPGRDAEVLYDSPAGHGTRLVAVSGDDLYLESYETDEYDVSEWDLLRLPAAGGEADVVAEGLEYYNPSVAVVNGHAVVTENGNDVGSMGMRVDVMDLDDGEVVARYV